MGYSPRYFLPDSVYFITSRTLEGAFFLRPSQQVNNAIGAVLADAQTRYPVELFDFVFLSNHMHIALRSRQDNISEFMQYLKSNIAVEMNRLIGRHGQLWECRFTASPILDEGAAIDRAKYIYAHGVKEGLVDLPTDWPGLASIKQRLNGSTPSYRRFDRTAFTRAQRKSGDESVKRSDFTRTVRVRLASWPFLKGQSPAQSREMVARLAESATDEAREKRNGKPSIGVTAVLKQDPRARSRKLKRRSKPLCHATSRGQRLSYRASYSLFLEAYYAASRAFRKGDLSVSFPPYAFKPPLPRKWSLRTGKAPPI